MKFKRFCECGRPESITREVEDRLQEAFSIGMPLIKALEFAGAKRSSYYRKLESDVGFRNKMRDAQTEMTIIARKSLKIGIAKNPALALSYLERKEKDEFSTKQTVEHEGTVKVKYSEEARKRLGKYQRRTQADPV